MGQNTTQIATAGKLVAPDNPLPVTDGVNGPALQGMASDISALLSLASANGLVVRGTSFLGTATVTRGANTTAYTAGDVVGGVLTIANMGIAGMDTIVIAVRMLLNITAIPSGMTNFTLHLYNASPASAIADNGVFTLGSGDRAAYLGNIAGLTPAVLGTGTVSVQAQLSQLLEPYRLAGGTSLYAYLVTNGGFTPAANSETYSLALRGVLAG